MTTRPATVAPQARARMPRGIQRRLRMAALSGAALTIALAGCDTTTPAEAAQRPSSSGVSRTSAADPKGPFDDVGTRQGDEAGVAAIVTAWDAAWNAGDAAGLAATFVDDAEFINAMGRLFVGAEAIRAQHAITLAGQFRGSHTEGRIRRITFLSGTAAVLDVDNYLTRYEPVAPGSTTLTAVQQWGRHKRLVVKRAGVWRVLLFQNTTVTYVPTP